MKTLNAAEFTAWLAAYPRKLERDVYAACEPPLVTWNDFKRAPYWPDSVVARTMAESGVYSVIEDINAPVVSKIKPDLRPLTDANGEPVEIGDTVCVRWGWNGDDRDHRTHVVIKNDVGTTYESWGITGCCNKLRSMSFVKVQPT